MANSSAHTSQHSPLNSSFPVVLPTDLALFMQQSEFEAWLKKDVGSTAIDEREDDITVIKEMASVMTSLQPALFLYGLEKHTACHRTSKNLAAKNKTLTENADVTNISSKNPLVDLFYDLGENTTNNKLKPLLENAWCEDPLMTLKMIFNARSIHLGKSNRVASYKAFGWLAETHPLTLLANLKWFVRPVIAKKAPKPDDKEKSMSLHQDLDMVDAHEMDPENANEVRFGVSHGYWKDLLNLVVLAAKDQLNLEGDPSALLNQKPDNTSTGKRKRTWDALAAKKLRQKKNREQNERIQLKLKHDSFYRALHISVARLFADQLKQDKALLDSGIDSDLSKLSLAAKWAPSAGEFHDKHTFILSSIAEILFPDSALYCPDATNRELYLRHVRELYRKQYASPLRKALHIVERDIVAETFENINYERLSSLALDRYSALFMQKDLDHFMEYVKKVSQGTATISGATLLPSTLVSKARSIAARMYTPIARGATVKTIKDRVTAEMMAELVNGQWATLVKRVQNAGCLESSIAVCDVSGSMSHPSFKDGSCPMDSAIGLSLLIAEVTAPPFGNGFITFTSVPRYMSFAGSADVPEGLVEKVQYTTSADWGMNTDFTAVFEDVILPMAVANKLRAGEMVKQVFVFSDMQFDQAHDDNDRWTTSYDRIKAKYKEAGYDMPRLIFWNLASSATEKPVTVDDSDTALVSGYSQGMLRAFLESGAFDSVEEYIEEEIGGEEGEQGMTKVMNVKSKMEPMDLVRKSVENKAYGMLEVVD
ncbi:hypothetical protein IAQ61_009338 [Plenodomus lingam]|uniref:uncharacterized protein n=1 Tax=Leptosphaeria maculans TaxID=5022 RepID=UPI003320E5A4|nr:hypothetical protein IAQ61_009338 [Plenodomus lingam]